MHSCSEDMHDSHLLKSINDKNIGGKTIWRFLPLVKARNVLLCHFRLLVGSTVRPMSGSRPPSTGTPGFMAFDRKSIELTVCNPTIALSAKEKGKKKTLIQSLSLYLKEANFQPCHRRCLFKERRRSFWGCASLITHICCSSSSVLFICYWEWMDGQSVVSGLKSKFMPVQ